MKGPLVFHSCLYSKCLYNGFYCRWTRLRLTMEPFPAIFEPLTESVVIGLLASWAMSYLWEFSAALMFIKHILVWFVLDFILLRCVQGVSEFSLLVDSVLEINFWVWSSAGPVGLKFSGPSTKLPITLIIFNFFRSDPLNSTYFGSRFNSPKENRYGPSKRNYKSPHLVSHRGFCFK